MSHGVRHKYNRTLAGRWIMRATLPAPFVTLAPSTPAPMRSRALLAGTMGKELGKVAVLRSEALGFCDVEVVEQLGSPSATPVRTRVWRIWVERVCPRC